MGLNSSQKLKDDGIFPVSQMQTLDCFLHSPWASFSSGELSKSNCSGRREQPLPELAPQPIFPGQLLLTPQVSVEEMSLQPLVFTNSQSLLGFPFIFPRPFVTHQLLVDLLIHVMYWKLPGGGACAAEFPGTEPGV